MVTGLMVYGPIIPSRCCCSISFSWGTGRRSKTRVELTRGPKWTRRTRRQEQPTQPPGATPSACTHTHTRTPSLVHTRTHVCSGSPFAATAILYSFPSLMSRSKFPLNFFFLSPFFLATLFIHPSFLAVAFCSFLTLREGKATRDSSLQAMLSRIY